MLWQRKLKTIIHKESQSKDNTSSRNTDIKCNYQGGRDSPGQDPWELHDQDRSTNLTNRRFPRPRELSKSTGVKQ